MEYGNGVLVTSPKQPIYSKGTESNLKRNQIKPEKTCKFTGQC